MGHLFGNYYEAVAVVLFGIGFTTLLFHRNMIKKIIGFNIMDTAVYLFLAAKGYIAGRAAPVPESAQALKRAEDFINPVPAGLVLTGIVVSVSVTAVMLALTIRLYRRYHTLDIDQITLLAKREQYEEEM
ncbi:MAG: cation:proton antiporter subunit C [Lachnospiraceae bacterium]|nr:cation:proton antiporter subunit C [Lachnospiraceae bacterium]